ncbi:glycosyltransferase [Frigoriflavimonas asaccharolytica]|uniref:Glycosyltransferase involved in cell wall biosynthesis n=1 Tax=Frigoriflavimonas asaccharolytica TaxID=2735899 RepID=A0A8J8K948_9FLAO|nr:glycosyltransferase [Frigoriflavimonas asaccharolytica]NRS92672.1 glycosyltransferase involved in cell wall biosynthesis [Frigoriflavimonas asaccharolytica]
MNISICITTYNHEKYIEECLMSIFAQEFSGNYEIIIGNDNSSDETENIIQKLIANHPKGNKIKYFKNVPNLGYVKNTLFTFSNAKGKYIAILDGDDSWIDHLKLQKQFDFLEKNSTYSAVGCNSKTVYADLSILPHAYSELPDRSLEKEDLTDISLFQTSTFFFRKDILKKDFPTDILSADRCLYLLAGCFGKIYFFSDQMAIYRQIGESISKNVSFEVMKKDFAIIPFIKKYGADYKLSKLKTYFYYTLMTYPKSVSKKNFDFAAFGYAFNNILSKFTLHPLKLYSAIKWTKHTIRQKYDFKKNENQFI